ncbi:hypothetical protein ABIB62_002213 [Mucilaginibacter sp. UYP25]
MKVYKGIIAKDVNRIANYLDAFMLQNDIDPKNIDSLSFNGWYIYSW